MRRFFFFVMMGLLLACQPTTDLTLTPNASLAPPLAPSISPIPTLASAASALPMPTTDVGTVPFKTLALNESREGVNDTIVTKETQLLLIQDVEQAGTLEPMISAEDFMRLQDVDYQTSAVIALFRGLQGSSNYQTMIQQISRHGDRLIVAADLWEPGLGYASTAALTYPYHLVTIARKDLPSPQTILQLEPTLITPTPPAK